MSSRCVVNVAVGAKYVRGQTRLSHALSLLSTVAFRWFYTNGYPIGAPIHQDVPFAFKAYALKEAANAGHTRLLWLDSSMVPVNSLEPIWEYAHNHGVWFNRNGMYNAEWTDEKTLPDLFPHDSIEHARILNGNVEHVVAGAFAIDLTHPDGKQFLNEYFRLASRTRAFCGVGRGPKGVAHRHDQTAASVICWRLGVPLTSSPAFFAYKGREIERTIIVADGNI